MWYQPSTQTVFTLHSGIRAAYPDTSFPAVLDDTIFAEFGIFPVTPTVPVFDAATHKATQFDPVEIDGVWTQQWDVVALTQAEIDAAYQASVPQEISRAQFILALLHTSPDLLDAVEAAIANSDRATQINYKERLTFRRDFPLVATMAAALGKTDLEIDAIFILGATL